jgi:hemolysin activation/secretion protein
VLLALWLAAPAAIAPAGAQAPVVDAVRIQGLANVPEEQVRPALKLKPGEQFNTAQMEEDRKALLRLGIFRSVSAAQRTNNARTEVTYRVTEWPRVAHIRILGNTLVDRKTILDALATRVGQVFSAARLRDDISAIEQVYRERDYAAHVSEGLLDEVVKSGILRFEILELQVGEVLIEGKDPELWASCRRVLQEIPPAYYRPEAVARDRQRLLKVRGVRTAVPRVESSAPSKVRIRWMINVPETGDGK